MSELKIANSDWASRFKVLVARESGLRKQEGKLSDDTRSASFELGPRPEWAHNLFIECRWEVFSTDASVAHLERVIARIVLQLRSQDKKLAPRAVELLEPFVGRDMHVRVAKGEGTIYMAKIEPQLPALDVTTPPFLQSEKVIEYGRACKSLRQIWADNLSRLNSLSVRPAIAV